MGTYSRYERLVAKKGIEKLLGDYVLVKDAKAYDKAWVFAENISILRRFSFNVNALQREDYDYYVENYETIDAIKDEYSDLRRAGVINDVLYIKNNEDLFETHRYARFIIKEYINSDKSISTKDFYKGIGIDKKVFNYCIENIKELDADLYNSYLQVEEERKEVDKNKNIAIINDMINGIKTGETKEGKRFDVAECLKMIPFKYEKKFLVKLDKFMDENEIEGSGILRKYLADNNIHNDAFTKPYDPSVYYNTKTITNGVELYNDDYDEIVDYMYNNNYPKCHKVFDALLYRKAKGVLETKENEKAKTLKITLIPSVNE